MKLKTVVITIFLMTIIVVQMNSCNKASLLTGTYDGITTTKGNVKIQISGYIDTDEEIPVEYENVSFVITKGADKNKIILKQVNASNEQELEAIGIVNNQTVTFLPFTMPISYSGIKVDAEVSDMTAHFNKGTMTYSYTYGYSQILPGAYVNIAMQASGSAIKQK